MTPALRLDNLPPNAELVLDRPEKRNALSIAMWRAVPDLIAQAVSDPAVKVVLIHAGDTGNFASGADISEFETIYATAETAAASARTIAQALEAIAACPKPVIAAIEGACVGGGVSIALAADLRIASDSARFAITPAKLGLVYPAADTRRLAAAIGLSAAKDLLFTGRTIAAEEAHALGLVDRICPKGEALAMARSLAGEVAAASQWSVRATKAMISGLEAGWADEDPRAQALFLEGFANADFAEGYVAFLEKRPARFTYS